MRLHFFNANIFINFKKSNKMKTNFYHVKFKCEYKGKTNTFSVDNIEAETPAQAQLLAFQIAKKEAKYSVDIIMKRNKSQKCKTI